MATVTRILPWRRSAAPVHTEIQGVVDRYRARWPKSAPDLFLRAYETADQAHQGQRRKSGEPYILHPVAVASVVAEMGLDDVSIAAALLHDAVEDTAVELIQIQTEFGHDVATIVDGVTKLDRVRFATKEAQQAATLRKMLVAMASDLRVLLIKLADRLHNMRTIGALRPAKQEQIARETLDVYAPIAHRLGMQEVRNELEDLAFAALYPKRYAEIDRLIAERTPAQEAYVEGVLEKIRDRLAKTSIDGGVTGRSKHHWSVYEKMIVKGRSFDEIFDLVGIRVVVSTVRDAYAALGSIHSTWKPVSGRFKDYIAMPKFNLYQSLHTTVVGPKGVSVEVQIRTREMHGRAEHGVAAHWRYKDPSEGSGADMSWLNNIVDWQAETDDPEEFMRTLAVDLDQDEVYVFTPKGDVLTLATQATPIDVAYAIHTDIGDSMIGAKIDGRLVPLDRQLQSGDTVEVFTSKLEGAGPSREWLDIATTPKARNSIRQWFARTDREEKLELGREQLLEALREEGLRAQLLIDSDELRHVAEQFNRSDLGVLFEAVGKGDLAASSIAKRLVAALRGEDSTQRLPAKPAQHRGSRRRRTSGVHVEGFDDSLVRLAGCCNPVPRDEILGFVTKGRGISVHRDDCANAFELVGASGARQVEVDWDAAFSGQFRTMIEVRALDRDHLLADVVYVISDHHLSISTAHTFTGDDQVSVLQFEVEVGDPTLLDQLLAAVRNVDGVFDSHRVVPNSVRPPS
ncbi:MAG: bifunctional (p)ppGpp synthetase/guanosine-3',5'-bis(diphosphate) 3'-pyrophosphohydrolase [Acidimicrobiales bacterium]|nr:bifunctional (p)ppGpp synthetase/guanosine-3',5'-bis(diphosphate) 3'-pyrophosphohydrolase [Acidimicrobiales bacterium]